MKSPRTILSLLIITAIALTTGACANPGSQASSKNLLDDVTPSNVSVKPLDDTFISSMADFSIDLFKQGLTDKENSLISPTSVMLALAMTANGADGNTLDQMQTLLGGDIPLDQLNEYLLSYVEQLPSTDQAKLSIANSIWFRDDQDTLKVKPDFLQRDADYYQASAFKAPFDQQTVDDINAWVTKNTDGMIDHVLDSIDPTDMLFLINAIAFDAKWAVPYTLSVPGEFTDINGQTATAQFMSNDEPVYLDDGQATGFIKPYATGYSFVALLPNEDVPIDTYIHSLTGAGFLKTIKQGYQDQGEVQATLPKFSYEYEISLNDPLATMGMPDAFDRDLANLDRMADVADGQLYISSVLHKTFISVDKAGTKAGAVTEVTASDTSAPLMMVNLNRPFVYAIVDDATNLPIFMGTLMTV